ncbi:hypothetical protein [Rhizobium sp. BK399]|uniref:hypothetical protein n=1 Tax=Rhizobium sp. BK399 TaxID=2587063 RepID=UPI000DE31A7D|nr:hypothetical protein [Rhizobium sp. BK399]MBB3544115.1 hypothetical protein [Rhizobium sp. BK399]
MRKIFAVITGATALICSSAADAVELKIKPTNGMCMITGSTAEEVSVLQVLDRSIDKNQFYYSDVFVPCETLDELKAGKRDNYYPMFIVLAGKTGGKLLPFATMTIQKLKEQMESMLKLYDFSKDAANASATLNDMSKAAYQSTTFDIKPHEQAIVDVTDTTISVAQKNTITTNGKPLEVTTISTSIIVDGYVATLQGVDLVMTAKDFWRLQFMTEWGARQIEVVK